MHNGQQSAGGAESDYGVSLFFVSTCVLKNEQRVIKDGRRFFERDTVLAPILGGFRLVPLKGGTSMFEDTIHGKAE
jgi:hypothetical protein